MFSRVQSRCDGWRGPSLESTHGQPWALALPRGGCSHPGGRWGSGGQGCCRLGPRVGIPAREETGQMRRALSYFCRLRAADGYHRDRTCDVFATQGSPVPQRRASVKLLPQFPTLDVKAECTFPDVPVPTEGVFTQPSPSWPLCLFR